MTDGSNKIYHLDINTFQIKKTIEIFDKRKKSLNYLNE